ncbi:MAG: Dyp-type peroxidase [Pseudonocardiaceae bacterium]
MTIGEPSGRGVTSGEPSGRGVTIGAPVDQGVSRRGLLRGGLLVGAGALGGGVAGGFIGDRVAGAARQRTEPFWGAHQGGIVTDTQRHTVLAAFDLTGTDRAELVTMLKAWTWLAGELARGQAPAIPIYAPTTAVNQNAYADATDASTTADSAEAADLGPARLTLTVGFGAGLFSDRFGLAARRPAALVELPRFPGDELAAGDSGGDLFLQACADDPQVAFHAVRAIARVAPDVATLRWTQLGYSPSDTGGTPRNLMGFKDGTVNSNAHPPADLDATVWAGAEGPGWMQGGSYLVYRRIRIALEHWDRLAPTLQEQVIGRNKTSGAPLGQQDEFDALDLAAADPHGNLMIPAEAHVRLAAPESNKGAVIVRRAFSFNNGTTPFTERWPPWRQALEYDAGLLFLAYQKDPRIGFVPIFSQLAITDALNQFTTHTASAVFAIPPGATQPGDWIGQTLLAT